MPANDYDEFKVEIVTDKKKADKLYSLLTNSNMSHLIMPSIPLSAMKDYFDEKRPEMWTITMNDEAYLSVVADKDATMALIKMIKDAGEEEFPLAPLPADNLRDFVNGQRSNVAQMTMRKKHNVQVRIKQPDKVKKEKTD